MREQSNARTACAILLVLSSTSWAHARFMPDAERMLIHEAGLSDAGQQYLPTPIDVRTEQAPSQILPPLRDDSALRGNCIVSSKKYVGSSAAALRPPAPWGDHERLRSTRMTSKYHPSRRRSSRHAPLLLFHCNFDGAEPELESAP
jgi:hypothetical protein